MVTSRIIWFSISPISRQGIKLITTIILSRLLSQSDFDLSGIIIMIGFIQSEK